MKRRPLFSASRRASVVLPVPGAPQRINDGNAPPRSTSRRRTRPSPTRCSCPTNSASERGRMRSARGAPSRGGGSGASLLNRLREFQRSMAQKGCIIIAEKDQTRDHRDHLDPRDARIRSPILWEKHAESSRERDRRNLRIVGVLESPVIEGAIGEQTMKDAKDVLRIVGMILLGVFVFAVGVPLVFKVAGITLGIISILIWLAVLLIKVAVVLAIGYLIFVGIRALLR